MSQGAPGVGDPLDHGQAEPTAKLYLTASASCSNLISQQYRVWRWLAHTKDYASG